MAFVPRYAITFGDVAVAHVGGVAVGATIRAQGFTVDELRAVAAAHADDVGACELLMLSDVLPEALRVGNEAAVLVLRGAAARLLHVDADALLREQRERVAYDDKYWDARRRVTLNKRARYNAVFADEACAHSADYAQPTVHAFSDVPMLARVRARLFALLGAKAANLNAEGNYYYRAASGIGYHGDTDRRMVVCLCLGGEATVRFHWRLPGSSDHTLRATNVRVQHGDVYVMSDKATGYDWRLRSRARVVHAAGASKYLGAS